MSQEAIQEPVQDNPNNPGPVVTWRERIRAASMAVGLQDQMAVLRDQRARARQGNENPISEVIDDMGHLVMGDINYHQHEQTSTKKGNGGLGKPLLGLLAALGLIGAPLLTYLMTRPDPPPASTGNTDTDTAFTLQFDENE